MKEFGSIAEFIAHIPLMQAETVLGMHHGLKKCVDAIEKTAKSEFGVYQPGVGEFGAWAELADATKADRLRLGFTENDPLERTHALEDSVSSTIEALQGTVGSTSEIMVYQEDGTAHFEPRPVLGPAAVRNLELIKKTFGEAVANGLLYGSGASKVRLLP